MADDERLTVEQFDASALVEYDWPRCAARLFGLPPTTHPMTNDKFLFYFGIDCRTVARLHWSHLIDHPLSDPQSLLWMLYFLKHYPTEKTPIPFKKLDWNLFCEVVWELISYFSRNLEKIHFNPDDKVLVVDVMECPVSGRPTLSSWERPTVREDKRRCSLKYEVAVSCSTGKPVFVSAPHPGSTPAISIFRSNLKKKMTKFDQIGVASEIYKGEPTLLLALPSQRQASSNALSAVQKASVQKLSKEKVLLEKLFGRLNNFKVLSSRWREPLSKHSSVFSLILSLLTLDLTFRPLRRVDRQYEF